MTKLDVTITLPSNLAEWLRERAKVERLPISVCVANLVHHAYRESEAREARVRLPARTTEAL